VNSPHSIPARFLFSLARLISRLYRPFKVINGYQKLICRFPGRQWQKWDWVQLSGCFVDILLPDISAVEGREWEGNTYVALDAHSTSRGAVLKISVGIERVAMGNNVPNVRAMNTGAVFDHA